MTARELATMDIKEELEKTSMCFISFRDYLNPKITKLVSQSIRKTTFPRPRLDKERVCRATPTSLSFFHFSPIKK